MFARMIKDYLSACSLSNSLKIKIKIKKNADFYPHTRLKQKCSKKAKKSRNAL